MFEIISSQGNSVRKKWSNLLSVFCQSLVKHCIVEKGVKRTPFVSPHWAFPLALLSLKLKKDINAYWNLKMWLLKLIMWCSKGVSWGTICCRFPWCGFPWSNATYQDIWDPVYQHRLTIIPPWISNRMPSKMWDEIIYQFSNLKGCTVGVWEWIIRSSDNDSTGLWPPGSLHTLGADGHI